jgi:hypothetical protein
LPDVRPQHGAVCQEQGVELAALGDAREVLVVLDAGAGKWVTLGEPPGGFVVTHTEEKSIEVKLAGSGHALAFRVSQKAPSFRRAPEPWNPLYETQRLLVETILSALWQADAYTSSPSCLLT